MNEELEKIRELSGDSFNETKAYSRIPDKDMLEYLQTMNVNIAFLYYHSFKNEGDDFVDKYIEKITENIYIILNIFNEMNIYPGYFFRKIFEMNQKYYERKRDLKKEEDNNKSLRGDYKLFNETGLSAWIAREIRKGLKEGYYLKNSYPNTNISDAFLEILALFQQYDIPYKITTKEEYRKAFDDITVNYTNIDNEILNSNFDFVDVECLCRLLFEYISFFVAIGINPKSYLDKYIEENGKKKSK